MLCDFFIVDTFSSKMFGGTASSVFFVDELDNVELFQKIAMEINTTETIFIKELAHGDFEILCFCQGLRGMFFGNCLFAAAQVVFEKRENDVPFSFIFGNAIYKVWRDGKDEIAINFAVVDVKKVTIPASLNSALNGELIVAIVEGDDSLIVEIRSPKKIFNLNPNIDILRTIDYKKIILTADTHYETDLSYDFCSRIFAPNLGVFSDVISPKADVALAKYWVDRMGKTDFVVYQSSNSREGYAKIQYVDSEFVRISGRCSVAANGKMLVN